MSLLTQNQTQCPSWGCHVFYSLSPQYLSACIAIALSLLILLLVAFHVHSYSGPLHFSSLRLEICSYRYLPGSFPHFSRSLFNYHLLNEAFSGDPILNFTSTYTQPSTLWPFSACPPSLAPITIQHYYRFSLFILLLLLRGVTWPNRQVPCEQAGFSPGSSREAGLSLGLWIQTWGLQLAKEKCWQEW